MEKEGVYPEPAYPAPAGPPQGYPQPGYPQPGYPQPGYPQPGNPQQGYPPPYPQGPAGAPVQPVVTGQPMTSSQQVNIVTVGMQPNVVAVGSPSPDYLISSILSCIFCCWILGIIAIVYAVATRSANEVGDYVTAAHKSQTTKSLVISCVVLGCIIWVANIIYGVI